MAVLNGLDLEKMQELVQGVQQDPSVAQDFNRWTARVWWLGGFKGKALARNHTFVIDEPTDLVGQDEAPNAVQQL